MSRTKVRFFDGGTTALVVCEVEAAVQHPLSRELATHLATLKLEVVHRETRQTGARLSQRVHMASKGGKPVGAARRLELQILLLTLASAGTSGLPKLRPGAERALV